MKNKETLLRIIEEKGSCAFILMCVRCPIGTARIDKTPYCKARLDKTEKVLEDKTGLNVISAQRRYQYAISLFIKLYGRTELFEVLI